MRLFSISKKKSSNESYFKFSESQVDAESLIEDQQRIKKKLRMFQIHMLFLHRMMKIGKNVKLYGNSLIKYNPQVRSSQQIKEELQKDKKFFQKKKQVNLLLWEVPQTRKKTLFYSDSGLFLCWTLINLMFLSYFLSFMPFLLAFNISNPFVDYFETIIDIYYIIDILVNFNLSYENQEGKYEEDRKKIAKNYLTSFFIIDLLTSIPVGWFISSSSTSFNKLLRLLKLPKILKSLKLGQKFSISGIMKQLKVDNIWRYKIKSQESTFNSLYFALLIYLVLHNGACMFIYIGYQDSFYPYTWIVKENLYGASKSSIYITAFYYCFVVLTTVGYGDVVSENYLERIFTIIWMLFGVAFYSFTISFITFFFTTKENNKSLFKLKLFDFFQFENQKNLPRKLKDKIIDNLDYSSSKIAYRWLEPDLMILKDMPLEIKYQFMKQLYPSLIDCPFLQTNNTTFIVKMINLMKPVSYKKNDFIWIKDQPSDYIIFITKGDAMLMIQNIFRKQTSVDEEQSILSKKSTYGEEELSKKSSKNKIHPIRDDEYFQELKQQYSRNKEDIKGIQDLIKIPLFALRQFGAGSYLGDEDICFEKNRSYSFKAVTPVEAFQLSKIDFINVVQPQFPYIYKRIKEVAKDKLLNFQKAEINLISSLKNQLSNISTAPKRHEHYLKRTKKGIWNSFYENQNQDINRVKSLEDIYESVNLLSPMEQIIKNINVNIVDEDLTEEIDLNDVKTPGLMKMYHEYRVKKVKRRTQQLYTKQSHSKQRNALKSTSLLQDTIYLDKSLDLTNAGIQDIDSKVRDTIFLVDEAKQNMNKIKNFLKDLNQFQHIEFPSQYPLLLHFLQPQQSPSSLHLPAPYLLLFSSTLQSLFLQFDTPLQEPFEQYLAPQHSSLVLHLPIPF